MTTAIFAALLISLGAIALQTARRSSLRAAVAQRNAVAARELDRIIASPFDSLPVREGCATPTPILPYRRCIDMEPLSPRVRRITLVIAPADGRVRPDTVVIDRAQSGQRPLLGH